MNNDHKKLLQKSFCIMVGALVVLMGTGIIFNASHAQVTEEWVDRYNGTSDIDDQATAITIDEYGNIYVAGRTGISEYVAIKYDPSGNRLWIATTPVLSGSCVPLPQFVLITQEMFMWFPCA